MKYLATTANKNLFRLSALSLALALAGCGGGGDTLQPEPCLGTGCSGSGGNTGGSGGNTGGDTGGTGGDPTVPAQPVKVTPLLVLDNDDQITRYVTAQGATAKVTVTNANDEPISGALVTFSGEGVKFGSSNNAVLTDVNGVARISIVPNDPNDTGSYPISATASYEGDSASTQPYNISVQAANIAIVDFSAVDTQLVAGASTLLTLVTKDLNTNVIQNNIAVNFSTNCGSFTNSEVFSSNQGNVSTTYRAIDKNGKLCEGRQTIKATPTNNNSASQVISIQIDKIQATSIAYTSAEGITLGAKSSGSATTSSVEFTVYSNNIPAANKEVKIALKEAPPDFSYGTNGNRQSPITRTSDSDGKVKLSVYPGDVPGPVELRAYLADDPSVFASSKKLAVATSRPTQYGITLNVPDRVLPRVIGTTTDITVLLTDRQGNFVPPGTVVSFVSEGGTITPNCSTDTDGKCSVTFRVQNPIPDDGRVSILAFVEGDKAYIDVNGDNFYSPGDDTLIHNIHTAYRDDNENMQYDADKGEFKYSRGNAGTINCASTSFFGPNVDSSKGDEYKCNDGLDAILRRQTIVGIANRTPTLVDFDYITEEEAKADTSLVANTIVFKMYGNGTRTLPMPTNTEVSITSEDKTDANNKDCSAEIYEGFKTTDPINLYRVYVDPATGMFTNGFLKDNTVKYTIDVKGCTAEDKITLTVASPDGTTTEKRIEYVINKG